MGTDTFEFPPTYQKGNENGGAGRLRNRDGDFRESLEAVADADEGICVAGACGPRVCTLVPDVGDWRGGGADHGECCGGAEV